MKRLTLLLITFLPYWVLGQKSEIEFQETTYNFGEISEAGGKATHIFHFKNTGTSPLILTNVKASCGCTSPEWSRSPIAPGATGSIKVAFDPRERPGTFSKSISVHSNASTPVVNLTIRGKVKRKPYNPESNYKYQVGTLKISSDNLNFGNLKNTQQLEKHLDFIHTGSQPITLTGTSSSLAITVDITPTKINKGEKGKITVKYDASKRNDWGFLTDKIDLIVNNQRQGVIHIIGNISEDFSSYQGSFESAPVIRLSEMEANLENIPQNSTQTHEFYIQNTGKSDLIIRKIKTSDAETTLEVPKSSIKPGKKVKAIITYKTQNMPKITKIIQLITNDPQQNILKYKLIVKTVQ